MMQEFVVGIPPTWIHLMRRVDRSVLVYIETEEAAAGEEANDAGDVGDHASRSIGILWTVIQFFVYLYSCD